MKIRSITCFADVTGPLTAAQLADTGDFLQSARAAFEKAGYAVQTTRLALPPFATIVGDNAADAVALAQALEDACFVHGIDYATIGPARLVDSPAHYQIIPSVLVETQTVFVAAEIANTSGTLDLGKIKLVADAVRQNAVINDDGFGNLRFAALANVGPGVPFLPAAYHAGGVAQFALAMEAADLVVDAFAAATSLDDARDRLASRIEQEAAALTKIAEGLARPFSGIDFTPAPFPSDDASIGVALESLGVPELGMHGSLAATAFLTDIVQQVDAKLIGFSGTFLPLLEDTRLAHRGATGVLTVSDLLLYAAVCGTGLDTIPLAGDVSPEALTAILLDVAALALRGNKPLTARLMPMPGKHAGDEIKFDFPYFANGRVLAHKAQPLTRLLNGVAAMHLQPRPNG